MAEILHQITVNSSPKAVYEAITTPRGLSAWWTPDVEVEPREGAMALFGFDNRAYVFEMHIDKLIADQRVEWTCRRSTAPEWQGTRISFELTPASTGTTVNFAHRGWESTHGAFALCNTDWGHLMYFLKDHVEGHGNGPFMR